uniref:Uncharacterized protein n=1 Tax=Anopheles culicifacies TaxID=139723 RepID=A0A182MNJ9_9DIPT
MIIRTHPHMPWQTFRLANGTLAGFRTVTAVPAMVLEDDPPLRAAKESKNGKYGSRPETSYPPSPQQGRPYAVPIRPFRNRIQIESAPVSIRRRNRFHRLMIARVALGMLEQSDPFRLHTATYNVALRWASLSNQPGAAQQCLFRLFCVKRALAAARWQTYGHHILISQGTLHFSTHSSFRCTMV